MTRHMLAQHAPAAKPAAGHGPRGAIGLLSSPGKEIPETYVEFASALGHRLGHAGADVVFGGDGSGALGAAVRAAIAGGSRVTNVVPAHLMRHRVPLAGCAVYVVPNDLDHRQLVRRLVRQFVVLPGGLDTLAALGTHTARQDHGTPSEPVVLANLDGYFDPLTRLLDRALQERVITTQERHMVADAETVDEVLDLLRIPRAE
ncbi:LOG family protein [Amycolatopsis sp. NPDC059021]|uniref:LOG family protein n=1 Tax=Amycolatopsis sp. NPDC059021 TaxID=3346704 RepID=UPI00366BF9EC